MSDITKQDLLDMETRVVSSLKASLDECSEGMETKLLTAFHKRARSMETRVRMNTTQAAGLEERLGYIEERLSELERKE